MKTIPEPIKNLLKKKEKTGLVMYMAYSFLVGDVNLIVKGNRAEIEKNSECSGLVGLQDADVLAKEMIKKSTVFEFNGTKKYGKIKLELKGKFRLKKTDWKSAYNPTFNFEVLVQEGGLFSRKKKEEKVKVKGNFFEAEFNGEKISVTDLKKGNKYYSAIIVALFEIWIQTLRGQGKEIMKELGVGV
jgi:hypothetical protein